MKFKPFNLELARAGEPVVVVEDENPHPAVILDLDFITNNGTNAVVVKVRIDKTDLLYTFLQSGRPVACVSDRRLMHLVKKVKMWLNVISDPQCGRVAYLYNTEQEAKENLACGTKVIMAQPIEWEE